MSEEMREDAQSGIRRTRSTQVGKLARASETAEARRLIHQTHGAHQEITRELAREVTRAHIEHDCVQRALVHAARVRGQAPVLQIGDYVCLMLSLDRYIAQTNGTATDAAQARIVEFARTSTFSGAGENLLVYTCPAGKKTKILTFTGALENVGVATVYLHSLLLTKGGVITTLEEWVVDTSVSSPRTLHADQAILFPGDTLNHLVTRLSGASNIQNIIFFQGLEIPLCEEFTK